jgi:hypothetical protein
MRRMMSGPGTITRSAIGVAVLGFAAQLMASASAVAQSTTAASPPSQIDQQREMVLALSACPAAVAPKAAVYVRGEAGYVKLREGQNGFTALLTTPAGQIAPLCMDAEGTRVVLPRVLKQAELRAQGKSPDEIKRVIADGYVKGVFQPPSRPGVNYMLSPENRLVNEKGEIVPFPPHVMVYAPYLTNAEIGVGRELGPDGNLVGPATVLFEGTPDAMIIIPIGASARHNH